MNHPELNLENIMSHHNDRLANADEYYQLNGQEIDTARKKSSSRLRISLNGLTQKFNLRRQPNVTFDAS